MRNLSSDFQPGQIVSASVRSLYPDLSYIKARISVIDVAKVLGLEVFGRTARCWRPDNHKNGDRTPSVSFWKKQNRGMCFVCDDRTWSNVDLLRLVFGFSTREAIEWIAFRFPVPQIPKGRHFGSKPRSPAGSRIGTSGFTLEEVVRSRFWATLTNAERALLPVFCAFSDGTQDTKPISYRALARYAGVGSFSTISKSIRAFERMGLLDVRRAPDGKGLRACNSYLLMLDSPIFSSLLQDTYRREQTEIQVARQIQEEQRKNWRAQRADYTGEILSTVSVAPSKKAIQPAVAANQEALIAKLSVLPISGNRGS